MRTARYFNILIFLSLMYKESARLEMSISYYFKAGVHMFNVKRKGK